MEALQAQQAVTVVLDLYGLLLDLLMQVVEQELHVMQLVLVTFRELEAQAAAELVDMNKEQEAEQLEPLIQEAEAEEDTLLEDMERQVDQEL